MNTHTENTHTQYINKEKICKHGEMTKQRKPREYTKHKECAKHREKKCSNCYCFVCVYFIENNSNQLTKINIIILVLRTRIILISSFMMHFFYICHLGSFLIVHYTDGLLYFNPLHLFCQLMVDGKVVFNSDLLDISQYPCIVIYFLQLVMNALHIQQLAIFLNY